MLKCLIYNWKLVIYKKMKWIPTFNKINYFIFYQKEKGNNILLWVTITLIDLYIYTIKKYIW
jgi:hypothetical protein